HASRACQLPALPRQTPPNSPADSPASSRHQRNPVSQRHSSPRQLRSNFFTLSQLFRPHSTSASPRSRSYHPPAPGCRSTLPPPSSAPLRFASDRLAARAAPPPPTAKRQTPRRMHFPAPPIRRYRRLTR